MNNLSIEQRVAALNALPPSTDKPPRTNFDLGIDIFRYAGLAVVLVAAVLRVIPLTHDFALAWLDGEQTNPMLPAVRYWVMACASSLAVFCAFEIQLQLDLKRGNTWAAWIVGAVAFVGSLIRIGNHEPVTLALFRVPLIMVALFAAYEVFYNNPERVLAEPHLQGMLKPRVWLYVQALALMLQVQDISRHGFMSAWPVFWKWAFWLSVVFAFVQLWNWLTDTVEEKSRQFQQTNGYAWLVAWIRYTARPWTAPPPPWPSVPDFFGKNSRISTHPGNDEVSDAGLL